VRGREGGGGEKGKGVISTAARWMIIGDRREYVCGCYFFLLSGGKGNGDTCPLASLD